MPSVFVNFRTAEHAGYAALLDRELRGRFGKDAVFCAPRSIRPGADFAQALLTAVASSSVLLAVIGPGWLAAAREGRRIIGGEHDWTMREIAEAFAHEIHVIPVLVNDAALPTEADLPGAVLPLARCQYLRLDERSLDEDLARVSREVGRFVLAGVETAAESSRRRYVLPEAASPGAQIEVISGDILDVRSADIWVNSENTDMEMARITEFSVSGIIRYWGSERDTSGRVTQDVIADELEVAVSGRRPVAPASVFTTGAGRLGATHRVRRIIHVAAVEGQPGTGFRQVRDVGRCVTSILVEADRLAAVEPGIRSVLLPTLGAGVGRADVARTARSIVGAAVAYLHDNPTALNTVAFLAYTQGEAVAYADACVAFSLVPTRGNAV